MVSLPPPSILVCTCFQRLASQQTSLKSGRCLQSVTAAAALLLPHCCCRNAAVAGNYADFIAFRSEQKAAAAGGDAGEDWTVQLSQQQQHGPCIIFGLWPYCSRFHGM
jgi:hypothetical protein